jgi:hypothetical protein
VKRAQEKAKNFLNKFAYNNSNDNDVSAINYRRVDLGVDYADEIIDYDEEVVFDDDFSYSINSNDEMVSEEVVNDSVTFNSIKLPKLPTNPEETMNGSDKDQLIPIIMKEFQQMNDKGVIKFSNESLLLITGKLRYLADRIFELLLVRSLQVGPRIHLRVNYLWSTVDLCLRLSRLGKLSLFCFNDASYITSGNSKSRLEGVFYMCF